MRSWDTYNSPTFQDQLECIHRILTPRVAVLVLSPDISMQMVWGRDTAAT